MKILSTIESRQLKKGELKEINIDGVIYDLSSYQKGQNTFEAPAKNIQPVQVIVPSKEVIALRDTELKLLEKSEDNSILINRNGIEYIIKCDIEGYLWAYNTKEKELIVVR